MPKLEGVGIVRRSFHVQFAGDNATVNLIGFFSEERLVKFAAAHRKVGA